MSTHQYPDTFNSQEVQIWNNAAFDNGESEDFTAIKGSWSNFQSASVNLSLESDCSKENLSPDLVKSAVCSLKSSIPIKRPPPLQVNSSMKNSQTKPLKSVSIQGFHESSMIGSKNGIEDEEEKRDERKIDMEIEEIEKEIGRLSSRLEVLRLEKIECKAKIVEKRGRIIPAKFMEPKQSLKNVETKINRRGLSLGPAEIYSKSRQSFGKPETITPVQSIQNRRKSCFWKLQEIDELKVTKERGKSLSLSPKSRRIVSSRNQPPKQAATTIGSKKVVKRDNGVMSLIQPKKLFKDGEKSVKKQPLKPGRIIASRYNQFANDARKRSLPDFDKDESNRGEKRRVSREDMVNLSRSQRSETRVKKRWEVPSELVIGNGNCKQSPLSISRISDVLPKIRTVQCVHDSPRDSGAAKRVAELVGRKQYFCADVAEEEEEEAEERDSVCQTLSFDEVIEDF